VGLEPLEFLEGREIGIAVVEPDDEADRHQRALVEVVAEGAAVGVRVERPAGGVHHQSRFVPGRIDLPQLLDADAVGLRIAPFAQLEALFEPLAQVPRQPSAKSV